MKKRLVAVLLTATMVGASLVGCSAPASETAQGEEASEGTKEETVVSEIEEITEPVTITFWHSMGGVNGEAVDYLVNKFNDENEFGITVEAQYQGSYDDAITKLTSAQIGNMGADLVQIYDIGTRFMIDSGWVIPMQELIDIDGWDASQIEPNISAYYSVEDSLYSMPFNSSTPLMYYNKDMFDAAGITEIPDSLDGIAAISDQLVADGGAEMTIALGIYGWFFEQFTSKQGLEFVDNGNGRTDIATAVAFDSNGAALNLLTKWNDLTDTGVAPIVGDIDGATTAFSAGQAAITFSSTASLKTILNDVNGAFEVGTAFFPKVNETDEGGVSIGGGSLWALNNEDAQKEAAVWEFVKFLVSAESQAYWSVQTGYFPVTTAAHSEQVFTDNIAEYPQFMTAIDQLHASSPEYAGALLSVFPETRATVETQIENMLNDLQTPEETVDAIASEVNGIIEDYNLINN